MRRVRRFFVTLCVLALFAAAVPVSAAERIPISPCGRRCSLPENRKPFIWRGFTSFPQ